MDDWEKFICDEYNSVFTDISKAARALALEHFIRLRKQSTVQQLSDHSSD